MMQKYVMKICDANVEYVMKICFRMLLGAGSRHQLDQLYMPPNTRSTDSMEDMTYGILPAEMLNYDGRYVPEYMPRYIYR